MAATVNVLTHKTVASVNGSQANGEWVRAGGFPVTVQVLAPASLVLVEQSNDRHNVVTATHQAGTALSSLGSGMYTVDDRTEWIRAAVASDGSGPRNYETIFSVQKES